MKRINLGNDSTFPFTGWRRCNMDDYPTATSGSNGAGTRKFVVGLARGRDTKSVSHYVSGLAPAAREVLDLTALTSPGPTPAAPDAGQLTAKGTPRIAGKVLTLVDTEMDGMFWCAHYRARLDNNPNTADIVADVFLWWCPLQGWAEGVLSLNAHNPASAVMRTFCPNLQLTFADGGGVAVGNTYLVGKGLAVNAIEDGDFIGDAQMRQFPFVVSWPSMSPNTDSVQAARTFKVSAYGLTKLYPHFGNPQAKPGFDPAAWAAANFNSPLFALHTWDAAGPIGIKANGHQTGGEHDQFWPGSPTTTLAGVLAERVFALAAYTAAKRPCHYREVDGSPLNTSGHPNLQMWEGRPQPYGSHMDNLGKSLSLSPPVDPNAGATYYFHSWWGPWAEHDFISGLATAARITGCPALHMQLEAQWTYQYYGYSADLTRNSSAFYATRAEGYFALKSLLLLYGLWDETKRGDVEAYVFTKMAHRISGMPAWGTMVQPWNGFGVPLPADPIWPQVFESALQGTPPLYLDGTGHVPNWFPYQQSTMFLMWSLAREVDYAPMMELAYKSVKSAFDRAHSVDGGGTDIMWEYLWYQGATYSPLVQGNGAHRDGSVEPFWIQAPVVLLYHEPNNVVYRRTLDTLIANAYGSGIADYHMGNWIPPNTWEILGATPHVESSRGCYRNVATGQP